MSFEVRVSGGDIAFDCARDESILDAAERAGFSLPYSCRKASAIPAKDRSSPARCRCAAGK